MLLVPSTLSMGHTHKAVLDASIVISFLLANVWNCWSN
jgi:hypothetical protein